MKIGKKHLNKIARNIADNVTDLIFSDVLEFVDTCKKGDLYVLYIPKVTTNNYYRKKIFDDIDDKIINSISLYVDDYIYVIISHWENNIMVLFMKPVDERNGYNHKLISFFDLIYYRNAIKHTCLFKTYQNLTHD